MPRWKNILQSSDELYRLKRRAVLREAMRMMGRQGYHNTSLDDIAAALQVSKGTLYNYIADKQEILFECHMMSLGIGDAALDFADTHGRNGYEKLRLMVRAYVIWMNDQTGGGGVGTELSALREDDRKTVIARRDQVQARMVGYMQAAAKDGSLAETDAKLAVYTIMGAINMVPTWFSPKGRLDLDTIARRMIDLLTDSLVRDADKANVDAIAIPAFNPGALHLDEGEGAASRRAAPSARATPRATAKPKRAPAAAPAPARKRKARAETPVEPVG